MAVPSPQSPAPLSGQKFHIPNLWPAFAGWKHGVNPLHGRVKLAVDARLEGLFEDPRVVEKVKAVDIGLFAAGVLVDVPYDILETMAFYSIWLVLWDDYIDGEDADAGGGNGGETTDLAAEYCRRSVAFVKHSLQLDEREVSDEGLGGQQAVVPEAPTKVCESFADVGRRFVEVCDLAARREMFGHLKEYMEGCVVEHRWKSSGKIPNVEEYYAFRLKVTSVDVMLDLCRVTNGFVFPKEILDSEEVAIMHLTINKLFIAVNDIFSLKKELKVGEFGNLIPIKMRALNMDLATTLESVVQDMHNLVRDFDRSASTIRKQLMLGEQHGLAEQFDRVVGAYQSIPTSTLGFSIQSPRYGMLKDKLEDGSFQVTL
ncbi:isoprenoid synthase domain-containing protein [Chaetomium sp. MPI-SDFR-AT-0129]|nr:isoprenoid synthase domain-containing protein [Chaetomium sp. MPI-SDFR-AT-0129]